MNYGNQLKTIRISKKLTQEQIASFLNINRSTYKEYELQNSIIPSKHLWNLTNSFTEIRKYNNTNQKLDRAKSGSRLKEFRKENKMTQLKLASILNTTQSVIADYEKGRYLIATPFLYTICFKFHLSADYLLGKVDNPKYLPQCHS